jgi:hypothetical protein
MVFTWKKIIFATFISIFSVGTLVHAQLTTDIPDDVSAAALEQTSYESSVNEGDFEFEITPENPGPHEQVSIKLSSNLVDVNRYPITWTVDGVEVKSGIGQRVILITTKDYGQAVNVSMTINLIDSTVTKQAVLTPQDVTLLWEAVDSYAPPFYEGKKLPAYEAIVRIVSIPNFLGDRPASASKNAVYNWSRNKSVIPDASGYGRDSVLIQHNRVRANEFIQVESSTASGASQAAGSITIPFLNPFVLFYERNPGTGIRDLSSKTTLPLRSKSATIEAEPYFFSVLDGNPNTLKINWTMNNKPLVLSNSTRQTSLAIQKPEGSGGATIGFSAENTTRLFQSAEKKLNIVFIQ